MLRDSVATESIYGFAPEQANVTPSEQLITLTYGQLQGFVSRAALEAVKSLQDRVEALEATVASQDEKIRALEFTQDVQGENQLIQLRLINDLREANHKKPGKTKIIRAEKIEKYLQTRPDHKASFETLKGHLGIDRVLLNQSLKVLMKAHPGEYTIIKTSRDKRKHTVVMLPKLGWK